MAAATTEAPRARRPRAPKAPAWARHTPAELTPAGHSDDGLHFFTAPSASRPGTIWLVAYDADSRQAVCDCTAAQHGRYQCWHAHHAEGAYLLAVCRRVAAELSDEALVIAGKQAAARVEQAARFWAAHSPIDAPMLAACRDEWQRRERARRGTAPAPAPVADLDAHRARRADALAAPDLPPAA